MKDSKESTNPDHAAQLNRLNRIKGQVEGIERMILDRRYCPDILMQIQAVSSALSALGAGILDTHLHHCVESAITSKDRSQAMKKIEEVIEIFKKKF